MAIKEQILDYQLNHGVFDSSTFPGAEGIAKRAVAEGFDTLSTKQKLVLEPYLTKTCSGVTNPGGHHNDCSTELKDEELLDAYHRCDDTECLVCESCNSEEGYHAHQWDKISRE